MSEGDRCDALKHLPRILWKELSCRFATGKLARNRDRLLNASTRRPLPRSGAPGASHRCYLNMIGEEWAIEVQPGVSDPYHGQQLAERTMIHSNQVGRLLF
ncbi:hypothetical protein Vretimale_4312 [Volvox reticuliferus]|uniref:Uncharacterized protein n=1 Tax=Volvox reticuliferus TaxID=1737510 RepID=A0A8J4DBX9_9CHLO|nr:hypothetical protein Vretifemale_2902 [Volvox reticuliferus]GIL99044.1 hypothetical protein Vretimale_4312 [Volvox reticuliferus]